MIKKLNQLLATHISMGVYLLAICLTLLLSGSNTRHHHHSPATSYHSLLQGINGYVISNGDIMPDDNITHEHSNSSQKHHIANRKRGVPGFVYRTSLALDWVAVYNSAYLTELQEYIGLGKVFYRPYYYVHLFLCALF